MPPLLESVLSNPWPVAVPVAVVAAALQVAGLRRGNRRLIRAAPAVFLIAAGLVIVAWWVVTDAEAVEARTRSLIAATAPLDRPAIRSHLASDARLLGPGGAVWLAGAEVSDRLDRVASRVPLDQRVVDLTVMPSRKNGAPGVRVVHLDLRTRAAGGSMPLLTSWTLTWRRDSEDWVLSDAQWVRFNTQPPSRDLVP